MRWRQRIPWWGWVLVAIGLVGLFGEIEVSVGNVSILGTDFGGTGGAPADEISDK